ncbi:MAG: oligosaccharide flippase family protein [Gammaproteobacteria bacterium]|nr:oligosaccharide flippase family protein [Gammaproteobacteria bacterium]
MKTTRTNKVLLLTTANIGMGIIHVLTVPFLVRYMSVVDYGIYGQGLLITTSVASFFYLGLSSVIYIFYSRNETLGASIFKTSISICFISGMLATLTVFLVSDLVSVHFDNPQLSYLLKIYCACLLFDIPFSVVYATLINYGLIKRAVISNFLPAVLRIVLLFVAIHVFYSLTTIFVLLLAWSVVHFVFAFLLLPKEVLQPSRFDPDLARRMLKIGIPYAISGLFSYLFLTSDEVMVSLMSSVRNYAYYHAGAIFIPFVANVYASIATVLLPELSSLYAESKLRTIVDLKRRAILTTAALVYPGVIFILIFSTPIITAYLTSKYEQSVPVFFVYNLLILLKINEFSDILLVASRTKRISLVVFSCLLLNIILNYFLIKEIGIVGSAIATVISGTVQIAVLLYLSCKTLECRILEYFDVKRITLIALASAIAPASLYSILPISGNIFVLFLQGVVCLCISYYILIKTRLLDIEVIRPITRQIPYLNGLTNRLFPSAK